MEKSLFNFELPKELIAQTPIEPRDASRLMILNRANRTIQHEHFYNLIDYLEPGDLLVLNDSRVLPARLYALRDDGSILLEILLVKQLSERVWEVMAKPGKRAKVGSFFNFGELSAKVIEILPDGNRVLEFKFDGDFFEILKRIGNIPLPHYIKADLADKERYQTVYSNELGSVAAPTAGLHFTNQMLDKLATSRIGVAFVTLHVGPGTFKPVKVDNIVEHKMHEESFTLPERTVKLIKEAKRRGKRVIAVGTTSCRVLESVCSKYGELRATSESTDIFIYPGYKFLAIDGLLTNFHLPESTLIMLVSALAGREFILEAYNLAVKMNYRFFSFGDAMLIL
jgi:S-adenosylmethionine:tRNA ribosyltransferase-isomerase